MVAEFIGPYAELPAAHSECDKFIEDNAHVLGGPCWEIYDGPPAEDGTAKTLIYYPIVP
jgi:effector-binding domain-containing protein